MALESDITKIFDSQLIQDDWEDSRKYWRDDNKLGQIINTSFAGLPTGKQSQQLKGFVVNSSSGGCSLVVISETALSLGQPCQLFFEPLAPVSAKVIWLKQIHRSVYRLGCQYTGET